MVKNGSSHGQKQALCRACGTNVSIRYSTAYLDLHAAPAIFETAASKLITAVEGHYPIPKGRETGNTKQTYSLEASSLLDRESQRADFHLAREGGT